MIKKLMNISGTQVLGKEEQQLLMGGTRYRCACNNGEGIWYGTYASAELAGERASYLCGERKGSCTAQ